jgi:hypothetical protein
MRRSIHSILLAALALEVILAGCASRGAGGNGVAAGGSTAGAPGHEFLCFATFVSGGLEHLQMFDLTAGALVPLPNDYAPYTTYEPDPMDASDDGRVILCDANGPCVYDRTEGHMVALAGSFWLPSSHAITPDGRYFLADERIYDLANPSGYPSPDLWDLPSATIGRDLSADARRALDSRGRVLQRATPAPIFDATADLGLTPDPAAMERLVLDGRHAYFQTTAGDVVLADVDAKARVPLPGLEAWKAASGPFDLRLEDAGRDGRFLLVSCDAATAPFDAAHQLSLYDAASAALAAT